LDIAYTFFECVDACARDVASKKPVSIRHSTQWEAFVRAGSTDADMFSGYYLKCAAQSKPVVTLASLKCVN